MKKNNLVVAALAAWILTATNPTSGKTEQYRHKTEQSCLLARDILVEKGYKNAFCEIGTYTPSAV